MSLLAEEIVEEWLNRNGYFTIRGLKVGRHEIDLLAVKITENGLKRRHIEVQASSKPIGYVTKSPGSAASIAKLRSDDELRKHVAEWVGKKFDLPKKVQLRQQLAPGEWTKELVVHKVKHPPELEMIEQAGVVVHRLSALVADLKRPSTPIKGAAGSHLVELGPLFSEELSSG